MKTISLLISLFLILAGCAASTPPGKPLQPAVSEAPIDAPQQTLPAAPVVKKSIIPDINAEGRRGEIARMMLRKSTRQFLETDFDKDNRISPVEAEEYLPFISHEFERYDRNGDQAIDWQEFVGHDQWPEPSYQ